MKTRLTHSFILLSIAALAVSCTGQSQPVSIKAPEIKTGEATITIPAGADPHANFRCSLLDKAGNLWFGTSGAGIYRYDGTRFTNFGTKDGLTGLMVYSIAQDHSGRIWVGTADGAYTFNGQSFSRFVFPGFEDYRFRGEYNPSDKLSSPEHRRKIGIVFSIIADTKGNIWFATERIGLCRYNGQSLTSFEYVNNTWQALPPDSIRYYNRLNRGFIQSLLEDHSGNIWFSAVGKTGEGLFRYDGRSFSPFGIQNRRIHVRNMIEDRKGNIWMNTRDNGLCRFNGNTIESFRHQLPCDIDGFALLADRQGNIWSGGLEKDTDRGGCIAVFDGMAFHPFPVKELQYNAIWLMIEDSKGHIWFGTPDMGLYRFNGTSFTDLSPVPGRKKPAEPYSEGC